MEQFEVAMLHGIEPVEHSDLEKRPGVTAQTIQLLGGFVHHGFHCLRAGNGSADCRKCPPSFLCPEKPSLALGMGTGTILALSSWPHRTKLK